MATRASASNGMRTKTQTRTGPARKGRRTGGGGSGSARRGGGSGGSRASTATALSKASDVNIEEPVGSPATALTTGQRVSARLQDAGEAIRSAGGTVTEAVSANPVPAALIGAGVAWLLFGNRVRTTAGSISAAAAESELLERARERFEDVSSRVNQSLSNAAGSAKDAMGETVGSAAGAVREGTNRLGQYTQESARAVGSTLSAGASAIGERAQRGYEYSREGVSNAWQQHPLTAGLTVLAAGVAIGMMLPGTVRENGIMGRQSDAVARRVKSAARTVTKRGKKVIKSVTQSLKQETAGEGLVVAAVARKARRIAGHIQEATMDAIKRE